MMKNRMMNWQHRLDATLREMTRLKMGGWLRRLLPQARGAIPFTG